jgi:plastocyanin
MKRRHFWVVTLAVLLLAAKGYGAAAPNDKSGIIKGTITSGGKPTTDVVVFLQGVGPDQIKLRNAAVTKKAVLDQREMRFVPHVLPVLVGTTVEFPNNDKNWHNVYSKSEAKEFDLGLYAPGKTRSAKFDKPGVVRILCNVHPAMEAFIVVKEHAFFAAADKQGNYRLDAVPLGKYRVQLWHPQLGTRETAVEIVRDGEVLDVSFDLKKK